MAGRPRGMQFTDDFDSSSSVGVIALIFASAHGWNTGLSSGVFLASNVPSAAGSTPKRPLTPCPAPLGNQCPVKSGWPSASRGAGPPGGITLIAYSLSWAPAGNDSRHQSVVAAIQVTRSRRRSFMVNLAFFPAVSGGASLVLKLAD